MKKSLIVAAVSVIGLMAAVDAQACASCGCTLSSDWESLNLSGHAGFRVDLRYDYLDQNQLRTGTHTISPQAASALTHDGDPYEIEKYTKNQYTTLGLDYSSGQGWAVNVSIPYIKRDHETLGTASNGVTGGPDGGQYVSSTGDIGDIKIIGRYQGFADAHNIGLLFGFKLPTGSHTLTGTSTDSTNPGSADIDRGLQPGTGTTDVIAGAYYAAALSKDYDLFVQGLVQHALNTKAGYRPGDGYNINLGLRYAGFTGFTPQLQLNARYVRPDSGVNADTVSTGGTLVYLSPGFTAPLSAKASVYAYLQVPLYQDVRGMQLTPKVTVSAGARYSF